jgi:membrane-bound serine protease (ClpP class)
VIIEILVAVVAVVVLFELFEHVIVPLAAARAGRGGRPLTGAEGMVGRQAEVRRWSKSTGTVLVSGELWQAESRSPLREGDTVTVVGIENLTLVVAPEQGGEPSAPQPSPPDGPPRRLASPPTTRDPSSTQRR